jgi:ribonuclease Y
LQHSREVSKLCGIMAAELGLNVKLAKELVYYMILEKYQMRKWFTSRIIRMQWAEKYGEKEVYVMLSGHRWNRNEILLSPIIQFVMPFQVQDRVQEDKY